MTDTAETRPLRLAPWVIARPTADGHGQLLLGPRLSLVSLGSTDAEQAVLAPEAIDALRREGFVADVVDRPFRAPPVVPARPSPSRYLLVLGARARAEALVRALSELDHGAGWAIIDDIDQLPPRDEATAEPLVVPFGFVEPVDPAPILASLRGRARVLWLGESLEGTHVGPLLRDLDEVDAYREATSSWSFVGELEALGFDGTRPLSIASLVDLDPFRVARAILHQIEAPDGTCYLLDEERQVIPWTRARIDPIAPERLGDELAWSKGLLLHERFEALEGIAGAIVGTARIPCAGSGELEIVNGKGMSIERARVTLRGEAIERFAAWDAGRRLAAATSVSRVPLEAFHPGGEAWERFGLGSDEPLSWCDAVDELSGERIAVPLCLVPFPYEPEPGRPVPTETSTTGLAAFPSRAGAVLRGALELLERHELYPGLAHLRPATILDASPSAAWLDGRRSSLLGSVREAGLRVWLLRYPGELEVPIVHAFVHDPDAGTMSVGSGWGLRLADAVQGGLLEALMIREEHRFRREHGRDVAGPFARWARPEVVGRLVEYLDAQPLGESTASAEQLDDETALAHVREHLCREARRLLVVELPSPVVGWSVVRVLIPGLTCHQYASESAGGRRLMCPRFDHGVPT